MDHMKNQTSALNDSFLSFDNLLNNWFGCGRLMLKYLLLITLMLLTTIFILPVSQIIVSCITKCMTEPPMKIMLT